MSLKAKYQVDIYTISYIGVKGEYTFAPSYSYTINDSITLPSSLHAGYDFLGWYEDDIKVETIESGSMGDRTFTAKYEPKQFKIIYNFENGQEAQIQEATYGEELTLKESNKQGYTFIGWENEGVRFDKAVCDFTQDITLYAKYKINTYTIIFDTKGGSIINSQDVEYLGKCVVPEEPTKRGYDFVGWFNGAEAVDFTTSINDNKTFVAKWSAVEYDIIYHLDGATNHINNVDRYTIEDNIILEEPTKRGYDFVGWYADESYTEEAIGIDVGEVGLRNLYANFVPHEYNITIIPKTYTISFDLQGGYGDVEKYAPQVVSITKGLTSPVRPSKAGYFFTGWYTEKECVNLYDFSHEVCLDMTLYAGWKAYSNGKIIGPNYEGILDSYFYSQPNGQRMAFYCLEDCNTTIKLTAWDDGRTVVITNLSNDTILFNKEVAFPDKYTLNFNLKRGDIIQIYNYSRNVYEDEIKISTIYKPYDIDGTVFDCNNGQKIKFGEDYSIDIRGNEGYTFIGYFDENNVQITDSEGNCLTPYNFDEDIILHEVWKLDE